MRILYTMPLCSACQERKRSLAEQGIAFEERPLDALAKGDVPAAALASMGLVDIWARRVLAGETWLVAPIEIEHDGNEWKLIYEGGSQ